MNQFNVTKLEAAREQLNTAIALWFQGANDISVCTLAYAAHEIIHRLYRNKGHSDLLFDTKTLHESERKRIVLSLKRTANFLKHSERETKHGDSIVFDPIANIAFILSCSMGLVRMGEKPSLHESAFLVWIFLRTPNWFSEGSPEDLLPGNGLKKLADVPRSDFLRAFETHQRRNMKP